ncbi:hypothetical protein ACOMHN_041976 [Nucella lapillus]
MEDISLAMTPSSFTEAWNTPSAVAPSSFTEAWNTTSAVAQRGGDPFDPFIWRFFNVALDLLYKYPAIVLCVGTVGNVMTIIIMRRLKSDDSTINIYFTAIAAVDLLYMWTVVANQVIQYNLNFDVKSVHGVICKIITWLYTAGGTVSCWYLICMTVHRAMSVVWPHRVNVLCTRRTVLLMFVAITVFYALLYSHYLIGYDVVTLDNGLTYKCSLTTQDYIYFHTNIFVYIELLVYSALPFVILVLANGILTWKLVVSAKTANQNLTEGSSNQAQIREKAARSVTLTVMVVSLTFLVLTLPSSLNFMINLLVSTGHKKTSQSELFRAYGISIITTLLGHTNHAINFYLYCLTGRRFREEFLKVLCCGRGGRRLRVLSGKEAASE